MKIETDSNSVIALSVVVAGLVLVAVIAAITYCQRLPIMKGYDEVQMNGSQQTLWAKPTK